jgi:excisionase family DNA binding protein
MTGALYTQADVAQLLRVSPKTVQRLTRSGELRAVYPGRYPRYTQKALDSLIASLEGRRRRRVA